MKRDTVIDSMDDKKSVRSGDADPSVDRTGSDPTGQQPQHPGSEAPKLLDLSWTQVVGGALAAMTAAVLGSRLGVAGTVLGAALASVCAAVFGSVYTTSIRRTQKMARAALTVAQSQRGRTHQLPTATTLIETTELPTTTPATAASESPAADDDRPAISGRNAGEPPRWRRVVVSSMVGAAAVFVVTIGAIAGLELTSGRTLDGNHGTTTVGEVLRGSGASKSGDTDSKNHPANDPSSDASAGPSGASSVGPQNGASPGDQASNQAPGGAQSPAPKASGPADSGSGSSSGQNSGGQNSGGQDSGGSQSGGGSDSSGTGASGSDSSGAQSNSSKVGVVSSGSSGSGPAQSGVSGS